MKPILALACLSPVLCCAAAAYGDFFGTGPHTFEMEFVTIGSPGNAPDLTGSPNPAGSVPYIYRIGKYEVSEGMIDKANMLSLLDGEPLGITKDNRSPNKPATTVTWYEVARFVNWLNTSTGHTPAYKFDSVGDFQLWNPGDDGYDANNRFRNRLAKYFLPSAQEWYKAAYYDPVAEVYYDYPTGSDDLPDGIDFAGDPDFEAVYNDGGQSLDPNDVTNVGVLSPFGTAGQGGNVFEWEETDFDLVNDSPTADRGGRGGDYVIRASFLRSVNRFDFDPTIDDSYFLGFRVASFAVPEPAAGGSALALLLTIFTLRRNLSG